MKPKLFNKSLNKIFSPKKISLCKFTTWTNFLPNNTISFDQINGLNNVLHPMKNVQIGPIIKKYNLMTMDKLAYFPKIRQFDKKPNNLFDKKPNNLLVKRFYNNNNFYNGGGGGNNWSRNDLLMILLAFIVSMYIANSFAHNNKFLMCFVIFSFIVLLVS